MTVNGRKYSLPTRIKDIMRFQETFPSTNNLESYTSKRGSRSLTPSPTYNRRLFTSHSESGCPIESISEDDISNPVLLVRSNSWSGCRRGLRVPMNHLSIRSSDSHRSSTTSLPDVIEEDSSEEDEFLDERTTDYDYMRCASCKNSNLSTSLDSISSENSSSSSNEISYCYKCKHLFQGKVKSNLSVPQLISSDNTRTPWNYLESPYSPRASRKNSNNGNELSIISEPSIGEETGDNEEAQKIVNNEVEKLIKFNNKKNERSLSRK